MRYLNWLKHNVNVVSFIAGLAFCAAGKYEIGGALIKGVAL